MNLFPEVILEVDQISKKINDEDEKVVKIKNLYKMIDNNQVTVADVWNNIFPNNEFEITYQNRIYSYWVQQGNMNNPEDRNRNVAFKTKTFYEILNGFYTDDTSVNKADFIKSLLSSGYNCGIAFGNAIRKQWEDENDPNKIQWGNDTANLKNWCSFDSGSGFGLMSYAFDFGTHTITVRNPFITDAIESSSHEIKRHYISFFNGYIKGVLEQLLVKDNIQPSLNNYEITYRQDEFTHNMRVKDIII